MVDVVAALITAGDRFLICRRPEGKKEVCSGSFPAEKSNTEKLLSRL